MAAVQSRGLTWPSEDLSDAATQRTAAGLDCIELDRADVKTCACQGLAADGSERVRGPLAHPYNIAGQGDGIAGKGGMLGRREQHRVWRVEVGDRLHGRRIGETTRADQCSA